jgi:hypothetical protein
MTRRIAPFPDIIETGPDDRVAERRRSAALSSETRL